MKKINNEEKEIVLKFLKAGLGVMEMMHRGTNKMHMIKILTIRNHIKNMNRLISFVEENEIDSDFVEKLMPKI